MGRMGAAGGRLGAGGLPGPRAGPGASWGRKNLVLMGLGRGAVGTEQVMPTVQHLRGKIHPAAAKGTNPESVPWEIPH